MWCRWCHTDVSVLTGVSGLLCLYSVTNQTHPHRGTEAHQSHFTLQIRGKDLVGGVKVMPMGLDAAIKKRTSGEFSMEVN